MLSGPTRSRGEGQCQGASGDEVGPTGPPGRALATAAGTAVALRCYPYAVVAEEGGQEQAGNYYEVIHTDITSIATSSMGWDGRPGRRRGGPRKGRRVEREGAHYRRSLCRSRHLVSTAADAVARVVSRLRYTDDDAVRHSDAVDLRRGADAPRRIPAGRNQLTGEGAPRDASKDIDADGREQVRHEHGCSNGDAVMDDHGDGRWWCTWLDGAGWGGDDAMIDDARSHRGDGDDSSDGSDDSYEPRADGDVERSELRSSSGSGGRHYSRGCHNRPAIIIAPRHHRERARGREDATVTDTTRSSAGGRRDTTLSTSVNSTDIEHDACGTRECEDLIPADNAVCFADASLLNRARRTVPLHQPRRTARRSGARVDNEGSAHPSARSRDQSRANTTDADSQRQCTRSTPGARLLRRARLSHSPNHQGDDVGRRGDGCGSCGMAVGDMISRPSNRVDDVVCRALNGGNNIEGGECERASNGGAVWRSRETMGGSAVTGGHRVLRYPDRMHQADPMQPMPYCRRRILHAFRERAQRCQRSQGADLGGGFLLDIAGVVILPGNGRTPGVSDQLGLFDCDGKDDGTKRFDSDLRRFDAVGRALFAGVSTDIAHLITLGCGVIVAYLTAACIEGAQRGADHEDTCRDRLASDRQPRHSPAAGRGKRGAAPRRSSSSNGTEVKTAAGSIIAWAATWVGRRRILKPRSKKARKHRTAAQRRIVRNGRTVEGDASEAQHFDTAAATADGGFWPCGEPGVCWGSRADVAVEASGLRGARQYLALAITVLVVTHPLFQFFVRVGDGYVRRGATGDYCGVALEGSRYYSYVDGCGGSWQWEHGAPHHPHLAGGEVICDLFCGILACQGRSERVCCGYGTNTDLATSAGVGAAEPVGRSSHHGASSLVPCRLARGVGCTVQMHHSFDEGLTALGCWRRNRRRSPRSGRTGTGSSGDACGAEVGGGVWTNGHGSRRGGSPRERCAEDGPGRLTWRSESILAPTPRMRHDRRGKQADPEWPLFLWGNEALERLDQHLPRGPETDAAELGLRWRALRSRCFHDGKAKVAIGKGYWRAEAARNECVEATEPSPSLPLWQGLVFAEPIGRSSLHGASSLVPFHPLQGVGCTVQMHHSFDEGLTALGCWRRNRQLSGAAGRVDDGYWNPIGVVNGRVSDCELPPGLECGAITFSGLPYIRAAERGRQRFHGRGCGSRRHSGTMGLGGADERPRDDHGDGCEEELFNDLAGECTATSSYPPPPFSPCSCSSCTTPSSVGAPYGRRAAKAVSQCTRTRSTSVPPGVGSDDPTSLGGRAWPCGARMPGVAKGLLVPKCGNGASFPPTWVSRYVYSDSHRYPLPYLFLLPLTFPWDAVADSGLFGALSDVSATGAMGAQLSREVLTDQHTTHDEGADDAADWWRYPADDDGQPDCGRGPHLSAGLDDHDSTDGEGCAMIPFRGSANRDESNHLVRHRDVRPELVRRHGINQQGDISRCADITVWTDLCRIGEAANPGPPNIPDVARRKYTAAKDATISYCQPNSRSLSHIVAPGHRGEAAAARRGGHGAAPENLELLIETVNTTGWRGLKRRMMRTSAHVILAQETWVSQSSVPAASAWARRNGWRSVWSPATVTQQGGVAAGVAILARDFLGLHPPVGQPHEVRPSRIIAATLEAPNARAMHLFSCYLKAGGGREGENAELLAELGAATKARGEDEVCVIGGDFNMSPYDLLESEFDRAANATIFHTDLARGTFRTVRTSSTLDYFMVSDRLAAAVEGVATVECSGNRCHTPVQLRFKPRLAALKALHLRMPPKLAIERVYGPLPPPPDWGPQRALAQATLEAARAGADHLDDVMEAAYAEWAAVAEEELEGFSGVCLKKKGERSKRPRLVWRSVLPEKRLVVGFEKPAAFAWLKGIASELTRIAAVMSTAEHSTTNETMPVDDPAANPRARTDEASAQDQQDEADVEADDDEDDEEADQGDERCFGRPPTDAESCRHVLMAIRRSLGDDFPEGEPTHDFSYFWEDTARRADALLDLLTADDGALDQAHGHGRGRHPRRGSAWDATLPNAIDALWAEADAAMHALDEATKVATRAADAEETRRWREWITDDIDAGASRAHAFTRLPQRADTAAVETPGGAMSSTPDALLDHQRRKYAELWRPAQAPFAYVWRDKDELPIMTPHHLREAAKTFKWKTAVTYDGFHPRALAALSDGALQTLALILQAVEVSGRWPRQLRLVVTALLPKPKGGFRPIGILPAAYRLWAKARRGLADQWEAEHARPFFSSAKGNGPIDTLWRMAARQEEGTAGDDQAAIVAEDLAAFFETIDRERLMNEATAMGYPPALLRGAMAAYSSARMLTLQGRVAREVHPTEGVIAGCSLAMSLVKLFYVRELDQLVSRLPPTVTIDIHVDDVTLAGMGPPSRVIKDIARAHADLRRAIDRLGCKCAPDKTAVTATTPRLASAVASAVGAKEAAASTSVLLGIDATAGGKRSRLRARTKKGERLRAAMARKLRLKSLHRAIGSRAAKVFRTGLLPAVAYDAPIWGVSDAEATRLRRMASVALSPKGKGRSAAMVQLWHGMPTAEAEIAPVVQYSKMIWKATTARNDAAARGTSLADIRRIWDAARIRFEPLVQTISDARGSDGTVPARTARRVWGDVAGPVAAAAVTLARLGWRFESAFEIKDPHGIVHTLTTASPCMVKDMLKGAMRDSLERRIGSRLAKQHSSFHDRRACVDLAMRFARPSRRCTRREAACFRSVACGAVWTASLAKERGYITDGLCPLCRSAPDTVRHRTYFCPCTANAVAAAVPRWFLDEAARGGAHTPFWTTAIFPHPADVMPPPRHDTYCEVERHHPRSTEETPHDPDLTCLTGRIYVDGSCFPSWIRGLARAACAIVMAGNSGEPIKTLQIPVPRHLPQTSQAAEYLGMAVAFKYAQGAAELIGDCVNVVRAFTEPARRALAPTRKYAGIVLSALTDPAKRRRVTVRWTKAHRVAGDGDTPSDAADIQGNAAADEAAKKAAALHPPTDAAVAADVDFYSRRAPLVIRAVTTAMEYFPRNPTGMARAPRPVTEAEARDTQKHLWRHAAGAWRCRLCNDFITTRGIPAYRKHQRCTGKGMADDAATFASLGHALVRTDGDLPIIGCSKCGAWGNRRTRKLGRPCAAPTAAGQQAVKRILAGKHPLLQRTRSGRTLPRAAIAVVARYDAVRGAWVSSEPSRAQPRPGPNAPGAEDAAAAAAAHDTPRDHAYDDTAPPFLEDFDPCDEEDVFGHGGGLDLMDGVTEETATATHGACPAGPLHAPPPEPVCPAAQPAAPAPSRRRRREEVDSAPRDFAGEAIQRLGASLRRVDTDAAGRMARLRQRISEKSQRSSGEGQHDQAADVTMHTGLTSNADEQESNDPMAGHDRALQEGGSSRGHKRAPDRGDLPHGDPPQRRPRLQQRGELRGDHWLDGDEHVGRHLRRADREPRGHRGHDHLVHQGPHSPAPARLRHPLQRGGERGDPGARQGAGSACDDNGTHNRSRAKSVDSRGGPTGIGGASAPASPMGHAERGGGGRCSAAAEADLVHDGGIDVGHGDASGASSAAARGGLGNGLDARAAAAAAASRPVPLPTRRATSPPDPGGRGSEPPPRMDAPMTRAQLLDSLRDADAAADAGGRSRRVVATASGQLRTAPSPTRDACTRIGLGRPLPIRGRGDARLAVNVAATNGRGDAVVNSHGRGGDSGAGSATASGGDADAASARLHPVPSAAMAGVEAADGGPPLADAAPAPTRRRLTGKQRGSPVYEGTSEAAASAERARMPPDKPA